MAILPPMPLYLAQSRHVGGLKPATRERLAGKRFRLRASAEAQPYEVDAYNLDTHGADFLSHWYWQVRLEGEHAALWGQLGLSPTQFLATYAGVELVVCHRQGADWPNGEGLMMVMWGDDRVPELRVRVHFWVHPVYRTPQITPYLARAMLSHYFDVVGYQILEGRTPLGNTLALRFVKRLGFTMGAPIPNAEWTYASDGTRRLGAVVPSYMTREMWEER